MGLLESLWLKNLSKLYWQCLRVKITPNMGVLRFSKDMLKKQVQHCSCHDLIHDWLSGNSCVVQWSSEKVLQNVSDHGRELLHLQPALSWKFYFHGDHFFNGEMTFLSSIILFDMQPALKYGWIVGDHLWCLAATPPLWLTLVSCWSSAFLSSRKMGLRTCNVQLLHLALTKQRWIIASWLRHLENGENVLKRYDDRWYASRGTILFWRTRVGQWLFKDSFSRMGVDGHIIQ